MGTNFAMKLVSIEYFEVYNDTHFSLKSFCYLKFVINNDNIIDYHTSNSVSLY